jgi:hypothetical protein
VIAGFKKEYIYETVVLASNPSLWLIEQVQQNKDPINLMRKWEWYYYSESQFVHGVSLYKNEW